MFAILRRSLALLPAFYFVVTRAAFAAGTGVTALDGAKGTLENFVTGLAGFAAIFLLGVLVWDFVQHRNIARSIFEFLGVVVLGLIAVNATTIATSFNAQGAVL